MTLWGLIEAAAASCAPTASFGDVHLWWDERTHRLYLQKRRPTGDAECIDTPSLGKRRDVDGGAMDEPEVEVDGPRI